MTITTVTPAAAPAAARVTTPEWADAALRAPPAEPAGRVFVLTLQRRNTPHARRVAGEPTVETVAGSEPPAVLVALFGSHGTGKHMLIDTTDWEAASAKYGTGWVLNGQVRAAGRRIGGNAQQGSPRPNVTLARIIMEAQPGERIEYRNGNQLDLRRANLVRLAKDEAQAVRQAFKAAQAA